MRRVLSHGSFLRFYLLLGAALLTVFLIALGGRAFIDHVSRENYREALTALPMSLMARQLADNSPRERQEQLSSWAEQLDMQLTLVPLTDASLSYFERARLERGKVLVATTSPWRLQRRLHDQPWLLQADFSDWSEQQWHATIEMLGAWLSPLDGSERREQLESLEQGSWPLALLDQSPAGLSDAQQRQLDRGEVVTRLRGEELSISFIYQLPTGSQWLEAGPASGDSDLPFNLHLPLLMALMVVLALIIYLVMRSIESRMARLELAATRIASGRLETRVKVESGDFLGRLGMAFNGMANQVQSLLRGQQEMIRAVSHELRTPVARIRFAVQMVEDMTDQPAIRRQLQGIDTDIAELDELVDEILTYARLGGETVNGAELEMSLVECRAMAERVIDSLSPLHEGLAITLSPGPDIELLAEPRYLQRALQNLVSNACRYGQSKVVIGLWDEPHLVRIDVEDDGPGVPADARADVFKPFARLDDSRARSSGGYGLGLSIVQKVMAGHGGSVTVDASPSLGGARFTLLIPRRESPA
ncbi:MAG: ATP-binding protein [Halomonas sp.]